MIRLFMFLITMTVSLVPAQNSGQPAAATRPVPKSAPAKRHPDGRPLGVPFSAVKISEGAWRAVEGGKPVIYRSTAFGFSKMTEDENARIQRMIDGKPDDKEETGEGITVVEKDGKLHFSRVTPFGDYKWVKEKTALTASEKAIWDRTQAAAAKGAAKQ